MIKDIDTWAYSYRRARPRRSLRGMCAVEGCPHQTLFNKPLCEGHTWGLWQEMNELATLHAQEKKREAKENYEKCIIDHEYQMVIEHALDGKGRKGPIDRDKRAGYIYYLQVGESIKIGYTTSLEQRMKSYPPNSTMLAIHPGTYQTEKQIHNKFNDLITHGREWFTDHERIRTHIQHVHNQYPKQNKTLVS